MSDASQQNDELYQQLKEIINWTCYRAKDSPYSVDKAVNRVSQLITAESAKAYEAGIEAGRKLNLASSSYINEAHEHDKALAVVAARIDELIRVQREHNKNNIVGQAKGHVDDRINDLLAEKAKLEEDQMPTNPPTPEQEDNLDKLLEHMNGYCSVIDHGCVYSMKDETFDTARSKTAIQAIILEAQINEIISAMVQSDPEYMQRRFADLQAQLDQLKDSDDGQPHRLEA